MMMEKVEKTNDEKFSTSDGGTACSNADQQMSPQFPWKEEEQEEKEEEEAKKRQVGIGGGGKGKAED